MAKPEGVVRQRLRFALTIAGIVPVLVLLAPLQLVALGLVRLGFAPATRVAAWLPMVFHRILLAIAGIRVERDGALSGERPLLVVANHVTWLDIVVVGSVAPLSFVAKDEMASWPVFGWLARMQRTIFIARDRRRSVAGQAQEIAARLGRGEAIVLFPEGTTSDGHELLPFKSALFEAVRFALVESGLPRGTVQPLAIDYRAQGGLPMGRAERSRVAWPGEIGLGESLIETFGRGALDVRLRFGAPITLTPESHRKAISARAFEAIRALLSRGTTRVDLTCASH